MTQKHKSATEQVKELQEKVELLSDTLNQSLDAMRSIIIRVAQSANTIADLESRLQKVELRESALQQLLSKNGTIDLEALKQQAVDLNIEDMTRKVESMVKSGTFVVQEEVSDDSFIVFKELSKDGQEYSTRTQMAVANMANGDADKLRGRRIGDLVDMGENRTNVFIQQIFKIVTAQPAQQVEEASTQ